MSKRGISVSTSCVCLVLAVLWLPAFAADSDSPSASEEKPASADAPSARAPAPTEPPASARAAAKSATGVPVLPETLRLGAVQKALQHLATIPRHAPRPPARPAPAEYRRSQLRATASAATAPSGANPLGSVVPSDRMGLQHDNAIRNSISSSGVATTTIPNRLGLQHADAMRDTLATPPVSSDRLGMVPQNDPPAASDQRDPEVIAESQQRVADYRTVVVPGYAHSPTRRLSSGDRRWNNYRYYDGRPSRHGYGANDFGTDVEGDAYRFGFTQGYDTGRFDREGEARSSRLRAHARGHLERGLALLHEGRYRQAADVFKLAAETDQGDPAARLYAAHALFATGRYRDGVKFLRRAFELQPKIVFLGYDMRDDYGKRADFDKQLATLQIASKRFPRNVDRLIMLGYVHYYTGQRDRAYFPLDRANKIDPRDRLVERLLDNARPPDVMLDEPSADTGPRADKKNK